MAEHDNDNLGTCGLCGRDPQKLEAEIDGLRSMVRGIAKQRDEAREAARFLYARVSDVNHIKVIGRWPWLGGE